MADPVPVVGDIFQVTFQSRLFNQVILNTFHYRLEITGGRTSVFTIHDDLEGYITSAADLKDTFLNCIPSAMTLEEIWVQRIFAARVRKSVYTIEAGGTSGIDTGTANIAGSIERRGDYADKHNVGRLQVVVGSSVDAIVDGHLTVGQLTALQDLADRMLTAKTGLPGTSLFLPVLIHKIGLGMAFNYVTVTTPMFTTRVMRRRTVGVGK